MSSARVETAALGALRSLAEGERATDPGASGESGRPDGHEDPGSVGELALRISGRMEYHRKRENEQAALVDSLSELMLAEDLPALLGILTRRARLMIGADVCYVNLRRGTPNEPVRSSDGNAAPLRTPWPGAQDGLDERVLEHGAPLWLPDYPTGETGRHPATEAAARAEQLRSILAVPLLHGSEPLGVLYAAYRTARHLDAHEQSLLLRFGGLASAVLHWARSVEQARTESAALEQAAAKAEEEHARAAAVAAHRRRLVDAALRGDMQTVVGLAEELLEGTVAVYSPHGALLAGARSSATLTPPERPSAPAPGPDEPPRRLLGGTWVAPVHAAGEHLGTLAVRAPSELAPDARRLLGPTAQALAFRMLLESGAAPVRGREAHERLLDELLGRQNAAPQQTALRFLRHGIDLGEPHIVVVVRREATPDASPRARPDRGFGDAWPSRSRGGRTVVLVPGSDAAAAARQVHERISALEHTPPTVASAGPARGPEGCRDAYLEASRCLAAMAALSWSGRPSSTDELGFVGMLLSSDRDVTRFVDAQISAALRYDEERCTDLVPTLLAYFETGGSPTRAALRLHVHPNTVSRRLERVGELLGDDWQSPERSFDIQLAVRLTRLRGLLGD
ncbi:helix-turn-helix domain-containing protein [Streptomyces xiaopingdaonensis]|uniref:helix-turn-helix domain-containing protein n=1 Tax=Streptomyces xiaopingdaonensis TaxID=1565415 RepID=UPI001ED93A44|nr:helix-turn-helix domain-containing protein [Streptomyces xiaopingdaonensis]